MKPSGFDIQFEFKCPKCGLKYWLTKQEAKTANFKIVCCGAFTIDHIRNIKVHLEFGKNSDEIVKGSYGNLKSLGYSLEKIKAFQEMVNANSAQELTSMFLKVQ